MCTHLTAGDSRTRANHSLSFDLLVVILRLSSIPSFREPFLLGTSYQQNRRSYVRRCIQTSSVIPPFISIGVISLPWVCRLLSRSRSRTTEPRRHELQDAGLYMRLFSVRFDVTCVWSSEWICVVLNEQISDTNYGADFVSVTAWFSDPCAQQPHTAMFVGRDWEAALCRCTHSLKTLAWIHN